MIVATYMSKYDKNALYAIKGYLDKEFPNMAQKVTIVEDHLRIKGHGEVVDIPMGADLYHKATRTLVRLGWYKSFSRTVSKVVKFLRDPYPEDTPQPSPDDDEANWLVITSSRIAREERENPMFHELVFGEGRRNATFKWKKNHDSTKNDEEYEFFQSSTRVFGFRCRVGHDSFLGGHVDIRRSEAIEFAKFLEDCFLNPRQ